MGESKEKGDGYRSCDPSESDLMDLLGKLDSGEGGKRTGELRKRGWLTWEVTEAGKAALANGCTHRDPKEG